jgi:hypothetical protein
VSAKPNHLGASVGVSGSGDVASKYKGFLWAMANMERDARSKRPF